MRYLPAVLLFGVIGCSGPSFTDLGNGVGVPTESIEDYAEEHGVSVEEAKRAMLIESEREKSDPQAQ